jgi:hypothetical protein
MMMATSEMFNYMKEMSEIREKAVRLEFDLQRANENASQTIAALQADLATMSIGRGEIEAEMEVVNFVVTTTAILPFLPVNKMMTFLLLLIFFLLYRRKRLNILLKYQNSAVRFSS